MCWLVVKPEGKEIPVEYLDKAEKHNEDGYGVSWYQDNEIQTFKTFNFDAFKVMVELLQEYPAIVHLRNATAGTITESNIHPFEVANGVMFHNGTLFGMKPSYGETTSDSRNLAEVITECIYDKVSDIVPIIETIIGDKINRLAFMENDGDITIVNHDLGIEEDGIWYSNDYHKKEKYVYTPYVYKKEVSPAIKVLTYTEKKLEEETDFMVDYIEETQVEYDNTKMIKVFVYGTLKRGYGNHRILEDSPYLGTATSIKKWEMIGKSRAFPYMIGLNEDGHNVKGELYLADAKTMQQLDFLEGYPTHYNYDTIEVVDEDGDTHEALVYTKAFYMQTDKKDFIEEWVQ